MKIPIVCWEESEPNVPNMNNANSDEGIQGHWV